MPDPKNPMNQIPDTDKPAGGDTPLTPERREEVAASMHDAVARLKDDRDANTGPRQYNPPPELLVEHIAQVVHAANCAFVHAMLGEYRKPWADVETEVRESVYEGIRNQILNPATPEESHRRWKARKYEQGYVHGPRIDHERKTHPNLVANYADLPPFERQKDNLFCAIVEALAGKLPTVEPDPCGSHVIGRWIDPARFEAGSAMRRLCQVFRDTANYALKATDPSAEQSAGIRKLLEAKDNFIRAFVETEEKEKLRRDMQERTDTVTTGQSPST